MFRSLYIDRGRDTLQKLGEKAAHIYGKDAASVEWVKMMNTKNRLVFLNDMDISQLDLDHELVVKLRE
jgi:hypothetical protein